MDSPVNWFDLLFLDGGYATSVSVLFAVLMFVVQALLGRRQERRQQTMDMLLTMKSTDRLGDASQKFAMWIKDDHVFESDDLAPEDERAVIDLLDFYETLCLSAIGGYLDRKVVGHLRGGPIERAYVVCATYLKRRRERLERPELYEYFELYCRLRRKPWLYWFVARNFGVNAVNRLI